MQRMMAKRSKIIKELIQTERDYLNDLELCVREVVQPLRSKQVNASGRASHHILDETASTANPSPKPIRHGTCLRGVGRGPALWVPSLGRHKHHQTHASRVPQPGQGNCILNMGKRKFKGFATLKFLCPFLDSQGTSSKMRVTGFQQFRSKAFNWI